jgi:tRNA pseudouridine38-40 synthase
VLAYDGTDYCGWQVQPNGVSIQELLQSALKTILQEDVVVVGSGRTDAGVHALGQVAHFHSKKTINLTKALESLNGILPRAIRVFTLEEVDETFHARYSAIGKEYHYHITLARYQSPFQRLYSWHVVHRFDRTAFERAAEQLVGTHDYRAFANESHLGCASVDSVRTIRKLAVVSEEQGLRLEFEGDGFLYKMVRNITGTLVEVALGKRTVKSVEELLHSQDRRLAGQAAPPQGLFLVRVSYD